MAPDEQPAPRGRAATRALRRTAAIVLLALGLAMGLIAFAMPTDPGTGPLAVSQPGLLVPWYALPVLGTAATFWLWPGGARRAWVPLLVAVASLAGWCALLMLW